MSRQKGDLFFCENFPIYNWNSFIALFIRVEITWEEMSLFIGKVEKKLENKRGFIYK